MVIPEVVGISAVVVVVVVVFEGGLQVFQSANKGQVIAILMLQFAILQAAIRISSSSSSLS